MNRDPGSLLLREQEAVKGNRGSVYITAVAKETKREEDRGN